MKEFYCPLNIFSIKQNVYLVDTESETVTTLIGYTTIDGLPELARMMCDDKQIYNFHLSGEEEFAKSIAEDIVSYNNNKYSEKKEINVEVN